jgi:hypothetical protein
MIPNLDFPALEALLRTVFAPGPDERGLLLLVDLPDAARPDHPLWQDRRRIAAEWYRMLDERRDSLPWSEITLAVFPHVGSNNAELPEQVRRVESLEDGADLIAAEGPAVALAALLSAASVVLAPTELSATAPLKLAAKELGFRGATLPDFRREMIPALALDWEAVDARVKELAALLDSATAARIEFGVDGGVERLFLDLRFRPAHVSGGILRTPGTVGNLPSGEAYIVPYEGERSNEPSRSAGTLPVMLDGELVRYRITANRALEVLSEGVRSERERAALEAEPAYGNLAELGLGVLGAWGIRAIGSTLLDEKLGLHIAFGRSDHFGGAVGPKDFRDPARVVHIDRVYVPECQPGLLVREVVLESAGGDRVLMRDGAYLL